MQIDHVKDYFGRLVLDHLIAHRIISALRLNQTVHLGIAGHSSYLCGASSPKLKEGKGRDMSKQKNLPWFRLYHEAIDDPKLKLLHFEYRWHYIALLCCKAQGILENENDELRRRMVAAKMDLSLTQLEDIIWTLAEIDLVDPDTMQPLAWDDRQFKSDSSTERVQKYREKQKKQQHKDMKRYSNGNVTAQDTDTETDTEKEKTRAKPKRFVPPTPDQVKAYCRERNNRVDAERFVDFYASKGWMVGKTKMRDWKASVRTWERSEVPAEPKRPQHRELT